MVNRDKSMTEWAKHIMDLENKSWKPVTLTLLIWSSCSWVKLNKHKSTTADTQTNTDEKINQFKEQIKDKKCTNTHQNLLRAPPSGKNKYRVSSKRREHSKERQKDKAVVKNLSLCHSWIFHTLPLCSSWRGLMQFSCIRVLSFFFPPFSFPPFLSSTADFESMRCSCTQPWPFFQI